MLLAAVWLFWPGPAEVNRDGRWDGRSDDLPAESADGLPGTPGAGMAMSAKAQVAGSAMVSRDRLEGRLQKLASALPTRAPADRSDRDGAQAGPEAAGKLEAAGAATVDQPPNKIEPSGRVVARIARAGAGATLSAGAPEARTPARSIGGPPPTVLAQPAAGPAVAVVRPGAIGVGADQRERTRTAETAQIAAPILRSAAAATTASEWPRAGRDATATPPAARALRRPTWLENAVAPAIYDRPAIAVVIDDLGVNRAGTAALNRLPAPLTLAFLPYAAKLEEQTRAARAAGHELLVHVPMEPAGGQWPGPNALTSQLEPAALASRLREHLRSFRGFVGINNHMGSRLTADPERMAIVMAELRERDLLFLDSRTSPGSIAGREAHRLHVPYAERDVFLDNKLELTAVLGQLAAVEAIARRRGYAVAIGHPHQVTIEALRRWLPTLEGRGLALAPISAIVARRYCAEDTPAPDDACAQYLALASLMQ